MDDLFAQNQRSCRLTNFGDALVELDALIDFSALAALVDAKAPRTEPKLSGRPPYAAELLMRISTLWSRCEFSHRSIPVQRTQFLASILP